MNLPPALGPSSPEGSALSAASMAVREAVETFVVEGAPSASAPGPARAATDAAAGASGGEWTVEFVTTEEVWTEVQDASASAGPHLSVRARCVGEAGAPGLALSREDFPAPSVGANTTWSADAVEPVHVWREDGGAAAD